MLTADKGARMGNMLVDSFICLLLISVAGAMLILLEGIVSENAMYIIVFLYPLLIYFGYYFLFEYLLAKTPGKYLTRTTVVDEKGKRPGAKRLVIRSVLRLIPYDGFSYIFGLTGLHDEVSRTMVVYDQSLTKTDTR